MHEITNYDDALKKSQQFMSDKDSFVSIGADPQLPGMSIGIWDFLLH